MEGYDYVEMQRLAQEAGIINEDEYISVIVALGYRDTEDQLQGIFGSLQGIKRATEKVKYF